MTELVVRADRGTGSSSARTACSRRSRRPPGSSRSLRLARGARHDVDGAGRDALASAPRARAARTIVVERRSTRWERAATSSSAATTRSRFARPSSGRGELTDVRLLAGRSLVAGGHLGFLPSGSSLPHAVLAESRADPARARAPGVGAGADRRRSATASPAAAAGSSRRRRSTSRSATEPGADWVELRRSPRPSAELGFVAARATCRPRAASRSGSTTTGTRAWTASSRRRRSS